MSKYDFTRDGCPPGNVKCKHCRSVVKDNLFENHLKTSDWCKAMRSKGVKEAKGHDPKAADASSKSQSSKGRIKCSYCQDLIIEEHYQQHLNNSKWCQAVRQMQAKNNDTPGVATNYAFQFAFCKKSVIHLEGKSIKKDQDN